MIDPENPSWDDERHDRNARALILGLGAIVVVTSIATTAVALWLLLG